MKAFEIALVLVSILALLLAVRKQPPAVGLGVAGAGVLVLVLHGMIEGFRYQLTFAYVLIALLAGYAMANAIGGPLKVRMPKAVALVAVSLAFILLAGTSVLAYALPVFSLPAPTGDYAVGVTYVDLVDEHRTDPFLDGSTQPRELMVKLYYPAKPDDAKPFSPYFHGSSELTRAFASFYQLPSFAFDHLGLVATHAKENLAPADEEPSYPVILFSHGAGTTMEVQTAQSEDLASHGYVVVAIDHTFVSAATAFPDRMVTAAQATTNFDTPEPAAPITQIMADDATFVIRKLSEMNDGGIAPDFKGRLNLGEIGVVGHSVGGAVAYDLAIDGRVKAAVNLDGAVYVVPKNPTAIAPFLMLASDGYHVQAIENRQSLMDELDATTTGQPVIQDQDIDGSREANDEANRIARRNITGLADVLEVSGNLYTIEGCDHMTFTDIGLFFGSKRVRELVQIGGQTDPARCIEVTAALTVAFFDQHLKGHAGGSLESLVQAHPELKRVDLS